MKIIINADDFGLTKEINESVAELNQLGSVTSTTVMVNMPHASDIAAIADRSDLSVGLHFNLSEGSPVSPAEEVPSLVNSDGAFPGIEEVRRRCKAGELNRSEVHRELNNQCEALRDIIGDKITHFDSHQGLNRIPAVFPAILDFGKSRKIKALRFYIKYYADRYGSGAGIRKPGLSDISKFGPKRLLVETYLKFQKRRLMPYYNMPDGMLVERNHRTLELLDWLSRTSAKDLDLPDGILEIPCHPATGTKGMLELKDINLKYLEERVREYEALKSEPFLDALRSIGTATYHDLK